MTAPVAGYPRDFVSLRKRADFLAARNGRHAAMPGFILQARKREASESEDAPVRVGFTCTKKIGNAVRRNHAKRRLREIARLVLPVSAQPGWDYVLIGRREATTTRDFQALREDLASALEKVHGQE